MQARRKAGPSSLPLAFSPLTRPSLSSTTYASCISATAFFQTTSDRKCYASIAKKKPTISVQETASLLEKLGSILGVRKLEDWYLVTKSDVKRTQPGRVLLNEHPSVEAALRCAYPEFNWNSSEFVLSSMPRGFWKDESNLLKALEKAEKLLGITKPEDWYSVTMNDLFELGIPRDVSRNKMADLLKKRYPDYQWEKVYLLRGRYAQQQRLEKAVTTLFPGQELKINARKDPDLVNPETGSNFEIDIYLPALNLGFEYQERHHYKAAEHTYHPIEYFITRDAKKRELAKEKGITLIIVPCWWDGKIESLVATIHKARPELELNFDGEMSEPISENPPDRFLEKQVHHIEDIGEPTTATFFTLSNIDPTNWWMFEKYDGVRGFWNPLKKAFYSRFGKKFIFPQEVVDSMPTDIFLDGELWFGRETFQESMKLAQRMEFGAIDWDSFRYMVFDVPNHSGSYGERFRHLEQHLSKQPWKYIQIARPVECRDMAHLETFFQDIMDRGGEGIILRDPSTPYKPGRSLGYLKHKKFRDAEARVIKPAGANQWECELPNGITFIASAGTGEFIKRWNPQPGDIVTFKHHGYLLATKKPKIATLYRLRKDITWEQVVENWKEQKVMPTALPLQRRKSRDLPKGYWRNHANRRKFFEDFAKSKGFDPLVPENWKPVVGKDIIALPGGYRLLSLYGGSMRKALYSNFPEWNLEHRPRTFWRDPKVQKEFLLEYAKHYNIDPSNPSDWLNVDSASIVAMGGRGLLNVYEGSYKKAIMANFPELDLPFKVIYHRPGGHWDSIENRKQFFTAIASANGWDVSDPSSWPLTPLHVTTATGGAKLLHIYGNSLRRALKDTYPDLKFVVAPRKSNRKPVGLAHWRDIENRQKFFNKFAEEMGFDPTVPENWYQVKKYQIQSKMGLGPLQLYKGSLPEALHHTYPDMQFRFPLMYQKNGKPSFYLDMLQNNTL